MKKLNFGKSFDTYNENALVQKKAAEKLSTYIDDREYGSILELGAGTGIFTREMLKKIKPSKLTLNDYFDTRKYFEDIGYDGFIPGDMNDIFFEDYDLICSSSSFQWIEDLDNLLKKLSAHTEELIFSIYIEGNLKEIKDHFGIHLNYHSFEEVRSLLEKYFVVERGEEEEMVLTFHSPLEVLRHMKHTGVTGLGRATVSQIKGFKETKLTYRVAYFKCRRKRNVGTEK